MESVTKFSKLFSIVVHQEAVQRMSIMVHEVVYHLTYRQFRDLVTNQSLFESRQEVEYFDWLSSAEAATLRLLSDAAGPLAVIAHDIWTRCRGRIVQPI